MVEREEWCRRFIGTMQRVGNVDHGVAEQLASDCHHLVRNSSNPGESPERAAMTELGYVEPEGA